VRPQFDHRVLERGDPLILVVLHGTESSQQRAN
jgi:hypothetical protein